MGRRLLAAVALLPLAFPAGGPAAEPPSYEQAIRDWRSARETRLRAEDGWLSVVGLSWLAEGTNRFGADPASRVPLPEGAAPEHAGRFELQDGRVRVELEPGVEAGLGGRSVRETELSPDTAEGGPDVLRLGRLSLYVIERGGRQGIRVKDPESPARRHFAGLDWYPIAESWRVEAHFEPHEPGRTLPIPNVLGQVNDLPAPGVAVFELNGRQLRLEPVVEAPGEELFFIFRDATSGRTTYGAGRFLYAAHPENGRVVLDFNKAYSPPCAFTDFATCPLPPPSNRLGVPIEAGERYLGGH